MFRVQAHFAYSVSTEYFIARRGSVYKGLEKTVIQIRKKSCVHLFVVNAFTVAKQLI